MPVAAPFEQRPALLLEGSWPDQDAAQFSLDEAIDARHAWIDVEAEGLAERAGELSPPGPGDGPSLAWLHALPLRYYAAGLLRIVAFADEHWPEGAELELTAEMGRDDHYAETLAAVAVRKRARLTTHWQMPAAEPALTERPVNSWLRRTAGSVLTAARLPRWRSTGRVLLCGNPHLLEPVCSELLTRGANAAWLFDRFAWGPWRRWLGHGVRQFVCNTSLGQTNGFEVLFHEPLLGAGVDLTAPTARWLRGRAREFGAPHTRLLAQVERCFARFRPQAVVLDEDATPLARAAVAAARRYGASSMVVQHGAPYVRFGFAPLAAEKICVWGESSRRRLLDWGVRDERILVTGAPQHDGRLTPAPSVSAAPPQILLLATTPPRDERADAVTFHLTTATHRQMLEAALAAVAEIPHAQLVVKLHPRTRDPREFAAAVAAWPQVAARIVTHGDLAALVAASHCVLSCMSSAGIEALLAGRPVIQLAPAGGDGGLPAADWGLAGTATTAAELAPLLHTALAQPAGPAPAQVFAQLLQAGPAGEGASEMRSAAQRVADVCLDACR